MLFYYSDSDGLYTVGIYSVKKSHNNIKKHIEDIICNDLTEIEVDEDDIDSSDFDTDTIIINSHQFEESYLDIVNKGIYLYIRG